MTKPPQRIGRYEIIDRIGQGAMGVVFRARDPQIGRFVAIKLLRVTDEALRERFVQEARSAGGLNHPNIVTVHDVGEHDDQPYLVMQYVEGPTLAEQIGVKAELPVRRRLEIVEAIAAGLDYAHNRGVVHRDVKPANIMIDREGVVKVVDFSIARLADSGLTMAGMIIGTPNYMSPEQVLGQRADRRSDIFSVGLVLYELLTYRRAFAGDAALVMNAIVRSAPTPLTEVCPDLDPALETIVSTALEKEAAKRYQTLKAMAGELAAVRLRQPEFQDPSAVETVKIGSPDPNKNVRPPRADRNQISKRRQELIVAHLQTAEQALVARDYPAAIEAGEQALMLDQDDQRAVDLLERARVQLDALRISSWLAEARQVMAHGDLTSARALVEQALALDAASPEARAALTELDAEERRRREAEERKRAIDVAIATGRAALDRGEPEAAIRAADEALLYSPGHAGGLALTREALALIEQRDRQQAHDRAAQTIITEAREMFQAGHRRKAIATLEAFSPPHEVVIRELELLRREAIAIERREREEEERRRTALAEEERQRRERQQWLAARLESAAQALRDERHGEAVALLVDAERQVSGTPEAAQLLDDVRARRAQAEAVAQVAARITDDLATARRLQAEGRLDEAIRLAAGVLAVAPGNNPARELNTSLAAALAARREAEARDEAAAAVVIRADRLFAAGDHAGALSLLRQHRPEHERVAQAVAVLEERYRELQARAEAQQREIRAAVDGHLARARVAVSAGAFDEAEEALDAIDRLDRDHSESKSLRTKVGRARVSLELERRVALAIEAARRRVDEGHLDAALDDLRRFTPKHGGVDNAIRELEERARESDRRQRLQEVLRLARAEFDRGQFDPALRRLRQFEAAEGSTPEGGELIAQVEKAASAHRRQRDALMGQLRQIRDSSMRGAASDALRALDEFEGALPQQSGFKEIQAELAVVRAAVTRRAEIEQWISQAESQLEAGELRRMSISLSHVLDLDASNRAALELRAQLERKAQAQARQAERDASAQASAHQARLLSDSGQHQKAIALLEAANPSHPVVQEALAAAIAAAKHAEDARQREIASVLAKAAAAADPSGAIELVRRALAIDPGHSGARAALGVYQGKLLADIRRQIDAGALDAAESALSSDWLRDAAGVAAVRAALRARRDDRKTGPGTPAPDLPPVPHEAATFPVRDRPRTHWLKWGGAATAALGSILIGFYAWRGLAPGADPGVAIPPTAPSTTLTTVAPSPEAPVTSALTSTPSPSVPPQTAQPASVKPVPNPRGNTPTTTPPAPVTAVPETTVPSKPPASMPITVAPTVLPQPPSTVPPQPSPSPAPTTAPTTSIPAVDLSAVVPVVTAFFEAFGRFDLDALRSLFPGMTAGERQRLAAFRNEFRRCSNNVSNVKPTLIGESRVQVSVDVETVCVPKINGTNQRQRSKDLFFLERAPNGWVIFEHYSQ